MFIKASIWSDKKSCCSPSPSANWWPLPDFMTSGWGEISRFYFILFPPPSINDTSHQKKKDSILQMSKDIRPSCRTYQIVEHKTFNKLNKLHAHICSHADWCACIGLVQFRSENCLNSSLLLYSKLPFFRIVCDFPGEKRNIFPLKSAKLPHPWN